jgi:CHAD domain-containing protein
MRESGYRSARAQKCRSQAKHWEALLRSVQQALAKVASLGQHCSADDPKTTHRLRFAFKKFRYTAELLQPVLPGVGRSACSTPRRPRKHP